MAQRKLLLPPFHGERVRRYGELMAELTAREVESWPRGEEIELRPRMQAVTLEVILRTVFGVREEERLRAVPRADHAAGREQQPARVLPDAAARPRPALPHAPLPHARARRPTTLIYEEIAERRAGARRRGARRRALAAAVGPPRGRLADDRRRAARRADDAAHRRPRDHRHRAVVGGRAPRAHARGDGAARVRPRRRRLSRRRGPRDAARAAGDHRHRPDADPRPRGGRLPAAGRDDGAGRASAAMHARPDLWPDPHAFRPERFLEDGAGERLHLAAVRRRRAAVPGRRLRPDGDAHHPARGVPPGAAAGPLTGGRARPAAARDGGARRAARAWWSISGRRPRPPRARRRARRRRSRGRSPSPTRCPPPRPAPRAAARCPRA